LDILADKPELILSPSEKENDCISSPIRIDSPVAGAYTSFGPDEEDKKEVRD
jgi:hypothetical protein